MKILITPDKFKGSLTATEVSLAIKTGILKQAIKHSIQIQPMADGGDGSIDLLNELWKLQEHTIVVNNPLFQPIKATYFTSKDIAFIEMSKASGLALLDKSVQNPLHTTSLGTGELILDAYQKGFKKIKLFIGGSATNDAGIGIATALGYTFLDKKGKELLPIGENLIQIHSIVKSDLVQKIQALDIQVICDVNNSFFGQNGAAYIYAHQKGADDTNIEFLDKGLQNIHQIFLNHGLVNVQLISGAGAAGGVGGGMVALFNAQQIAGINMFINLFDVEQQIQQADIIITGEGRLDHQSFDGKVVGGIYQLCKKYQKPMIVVCGQHFNPKHQTFDFPIYTLLEKAKSVQDAIDNAEDHLIKIGYEITL